MIQVEQLVADKAPGLMTRTPLLTRPTLGLLRQLLHEREVNRFLAQHDDCQGFEFIDRILEHFNFSYQASQLDRRNIPATGRVLIIANHPLGALDGLALLRLIGEIRDDVRIVANELLMGFDQLHNLLLPVDNLKRRTPRAQLKAISACLQREEAVIIFPAGEVSRLSLTGVRDRPWNGSYLKLAHKCNSPLLPIHVGGRNSWLFYTSSTLYRPLASLLLAHEMFGQRNRQIPIRVGQPIAMRELDRLPLGNNEKSKLVRRHLYRIARGKKPLLKTEQTIAHPQQRQALRSELKSAQRLGQTNDGKQILLFDYRSDSAVMRELGRLREEAFRQVGEGTGQQRDLDRYDRHYRHLLLWDDEALEIAGAYRIGEAWRLQGDPAKGGLYSAELFHYSRAMAPCFEQGIELGRSFVQPRYWGRRSLDYLWQGIGAYLRAHPEVRYLFGPVSLSGQFPPLARDLLVYFYRLYFPDRDRLARSYTPYQLQDANLALIIALFSGDDYDTDFSVLREQLGHLGVSVPTLYKQYSEVCEADGVRFLDFGVDADFGFCVDGLVLVDLTRLKPHKRQRYLGTETSAPSDAGATTPNGRLPAAPRLPPPATRLRAQAAEETSMNREQLKQEICQHEGLIDHLYRDTRGNATIGVGQLVPDAAFARTLALCHRDDGQPASAAEIDAEYARVMAEPPGLRACAYRAATRLQLPQAAIEQLLEQRIDEFMDGLNQRLPGFEQFPGPAQQALLDMAFNLGLGGLSRKFPKLMRAAREQDWQTCADECQRRGIGEQRNAATRALFDDACRA